MQQPARKKGGTGTNVDINPSGLNRDFHSKLPESQASRAWSTWTLDGAPTPPTMEGTPARDVASGTGLDIKCMTSQHLPN